MTVISLVPSPTADLLVEDAGDHECHDLPLWQGSARSRVRESTNILECAPMVTEPQPHWLVRCSCGWEREWIDEWSATANTNVPARFLGDRDVQHVITIQKPPTDPPSGQQLELP